MLQRIGRSLDMAEDGPAEDALRRAIEDSSGSGPSTRETLPRVEHSIAPEQHGARRGARPIMLQTFEQVEPSSRADSLEMAIAEMSRGDFATKERRPDEAIAHYTRAIEIRTRPSGPTTAR